MFRFRFQQCLLPILLLVWGFGQSPLAFGQENALQRLTEPIEAIPGTLVILGGDALPDAIWNRFVELAGGPKAKLVVIAGDLLSTGKNDSWSEVKLAKIVRIDSPFPTQAYDMEIMKLLRDATGVWIDDNDRGSLIGLCNDKPIIKELRQVFARGGVVGGTTSLSQLMIEEGSSTPKLAEGIGLLPGVIVDRQVLKRNRINRLLSALNQRPGNAGIGVDDQTAVIIRGRAISVVGGSHAVLCLPPSARRTASVQVLKAGDRADLVALSRSAIARSGPLFPPEKCEEPRVAKGSLLIGGGGGMGEAIWKRFIEMAGGPEARIVVIPTAMEDPLAPESGEARALKRFGAKNVVSLHTRSRRVANDPKFYAPLKEAMGVWFSGGRQWRFVDAYEGTQTEREIRAVLARGGAIGGSSAGASIQSEYMPRGDPMGNLNIIAEGYERGFGYLKGVAVDQHFFARKRLKDMTELMGVYPQLLGIGIDEGTVIIVRDNIMEVVGKSKVAVYNRKGASSNQEKDYEELPAGSRYDLVARKRLP